MSDITAQLKAPFYAEDVEWKVQSTNAKNGSKATKALMVPYIQARAIMDRLDEVVGIGNWRDEYSAGPLGGVKCRLSLRISDEWIAKEDGADNPATEPIKGGYSDSFKRTAVKWGIGRYLYDVPKKWYAMDETGKHPAEKPSLPRQFYPADADAEGNRPKAGAPAAKKPASVPAPKPAEAEPAPKPAEEPAPASVEPPAPKPVLPADSSIPTDPEQRLAWAKQQKVLPKIGIPVAVGQPLDNARRDPMFGDSILAFLTGEYPNASGSKFVPANQEQASLQAAAKVLFEHFDVGSRIKKGGKKKTQAAEQPQAA